MKSTTITLLTSLAASSVLAGPSFGPPKQYKGKYSPKSPHHSGPPGHSWGGPKPPFGPGFPHGPGGPPGGPWGAPGQPGKPGKPPGPPGPPAPAPASLVTSDALVNLIKLEDLVAGAEQLQAFSDAYWQKNRVFGGPGHMDTVNWIYDEVMATGYYDAYLQEQVHTWTDANQTLSINDVGYAATGATYGPNGDLSAPIVAVDNLGCALTDYPATVAGNVALISRGTCSFGNKVALAGAAGAAGAIIYNNAPGSLAGTLGAVSNPLGPYVPVLFVSQSDGLALLANITTPLIADILVNAVQENRTTYNVVAQTKGGDPNSVVALGAHSDSVNAGPGINDDGSGSIGILSVAKALTKFSLTNAVRFHWWTAEEYGLLGSEFYVASLNKTETDKIALYLNFDMIASPNYIYAIYDGDGSAFNLSGPAGSAQIEGLFEDYFTSQGLPSVPTEFNGRSDYGPFLDVGIPSGGLFTGAEANKTVAQAALFGGTAGVALDECYHAACDDIDNLALDAFLVNTKAIAHSIATYATDLSSIPRNTTAAVTKRQIRKRAPKSEHHVHSCSHEIVLHEL